jgi:hypothetical protein
MAVKVFSARVREGAIVPDEGVTLAEGAQVTVIADDEGRAFDVSGEEEADLLQAMDEVERGGTIRASDLVERLRE